MAEDEAIEFSTRLFQSAHNLRSSSLGLNTLMARTGEAISNGFSDLAELKTLHAYEEDGTDWVALSWAESYQVRKKRGSGRRKLGTITITVRLCQTEEHDHEEPSWPWLDKACIIVGWHRNDEYWSIAEFDAHPDNWICHRAHGLWQWDSENPEEGGYFFALPIFAIRDEVTLHKYVVAPLLKLFQSVDPQSEARAFLSDLPVLKPKNP